MVSVCLPSDALLQHLPSYSGFSYRRAAARVGALSAGSCESSYPRSEVRGSGLECQAARVQEWPGGATHARGQGRQLEKQPEEWWLHRRRKAWRSYPTSKVRNRGGKEIPFVQGKEQRLCFAGAVMKRYPMHKVRETQVRW